MLVLIYKNNLDHLLNIRYGKEGEDAKKQLLTVNLLTPCPLC